MNIYLKKLFGVTLYLVILVLHHLPLVRPDRLDLEVLVHRVHLSHQQVQILHVVRGILGYHHHRWDLWDLPVRVLLVDRHYLLDPKQGSKWI